MVEHLRSKVHGDHNQAYESKIVGMGQVTEYLNRGYDLVAALDSDHIVLRRKIS